MSEFDLDPAFVAELNSAFPRSFEQSQLEAFGGIPLASLLADSYVEIDYVLTNTKRSEPKDWTINFVANGATCRLVDSMPKPLDSPVHTLGSWMDIPYNEFELRKLYSPGVIRPGLGVAMGSDPADRSAASFLPSIITGMRVNNKVLFDPTHYKVTSRFRQDYANRTPRKTGRLGAYRIL